MKPPPQKSKWVFGLISGLLLALFLYRQIAPEGFRPATEDITALTNSPVTSAKPGNPPASPERKSPATEPRAENKPAFTSAALPKLPQSASYPNPYAEWQDWVEYQVDGDLALAFGDVVLGTVKDAKFKTGRLQPERPGLWPSPIIPYHIDEKLPDRQRVLAAIDYFTRETVIRFQPFNGEKDALVFVPRKGHCASYLGRIGGHQPVFLDAQCGRGEVMHEIMHALGLVHEHSRSDRDRFVEINWGNIKPEYRAQFGLVPDNLIHEYVGTVFDFDYNSLMLYDPFSFALNPGQPTLKSRSHRPLEPVREGLSEVDKERLYYLYGR